MATLTGKTIGQLALLTGITNDTLFVVENSLTTYHIPYSGITNFLTGGTYDNSTGTATFTSNIGDTFNVTGFTTGGTGTSLYETGTGSNSTQRVGVGAEASGDNSLVSGGLNNTASNTYSVVSGGYQNTATEQLTFIGGGCYNTTSGYQSSVLNGCENITNGDFSTILGGYSNTTNGDYSLIGGGINNTTEFDYSVLVGGRNNKINNCYATISGGYYNTILGSESTISGGYGNTAGFGGAINSIYNTNFTGNIPSAGFYGSNGPSSTLSGQGNGATFSFNFTATNTLSNVYIDNFGKGYISGDTLTFDGTIFGGVSPTDDVTLQITTVNGGSNIFVGGGQENTAMQNKWWLFK
jgi:hypothetical protein